MMSCRDEVCESNKAQEAVMLKLTTGLIVELGVFGAPRFPDFLRCRRSRWLSLRFPFGRRLGFAPAARLPREFCIIPFASRTLKAASAIATPRGWWRLAAAHATVMCKRNVTMWA